MAPAVAPFGAEFLVPEGWLIAESAQDRMHHLAIRNSSLEFEAHLMASLYPFRFVSQEPFFSILAQPQ